MAFLDNEEIKLGLFANDLTGFLRNDFSLKNFLKLIEGLEVAQALKLTMRNQN